jgi:hypothetical protein
MKYKIIVDKQSRTNPSAEKKEYIIDIEELRSKGDTYDSLVITKDEDYVMRRLKLTEFYVLEELETPKKEAIPSLNIELFEGDNYIYLIDMIGNKFYAEYLIKNEFNDIYVTLNQMHSAINQSAGEVEIAVNQKLTKYSTTEEMNAVIAAKSDEINLEVSKKVNNSELTGANISLRINNDTSEAKIKADKININGAISANGNFKIDTQGNMECNNGKFKGNIFLDNGKKVIGGDGLLTNLHFETSDMYSGFSIIGFCTDINYTGFNKSVSMLCVTLPNNFVVTQAYISLDYSAIDGYTSDNSSIIGRPKQIKLYYSHSKAIGKLVYGYGGGYFNDCSVLSGTQITSGDFTSGGVTDTTVTTIQLKTLKTSNINNIINSSGSYVFYVQTEATTSSSISGSWTDALSKTFRGKLMLDVIGYMN